MKPTLEHLFGMSNDQLCCLTDTELDAYLADALTVQPTVDAVKHVHGKTVISTAISSNQGSMRPRSPKHKGPSALAQELAQAALDEELEDEFAQLEAEVKAAAKPKSRV